MSRSTSLTGTATEQLSTGADKLIDGLAVAKLAGRNDPYFAHNHQRRNPTFPRQVAGGPGKGKALWSKAAVEAWLATRSPGEHVIPRLRERTTSTLDNALSRQFICQVWGLGSLSIAQKYKY